MKQQFPRTEVAGKSLPRILIGSNWLLGYSHRSKAQCHAYQGESRIFSLSIGRDFAAVEAKHFICRFCNTSTCAE